MSFDKFIKHASYFKPTMIVLKKTYNVCNNIHDQLMMTTSSNNTTNSSINPLAGTGGSIDNSILFDQSFGWCIIITLVLYIILLYHIITVLCMLSLFVAVFVNGFQYDLIFFWNLHLESDGTCNISLRLRICVDSRHVHEILCSVNLT